MYYVLWVNTGNEEKALQAIHTLVPKNLYKECFYPMRRLRKKIRGKWTEYNDRLLPGYLFITSEDAEGLYLALHKIPMFVSVLGKTGIEENIEFIPLPPEEEEWLRDLMGMKKDPGENTEERKDHIVGLSQIGFNKKDEIEILSGPLKNMSGKSLTYASWRSAFLCDQEPVCLFKRTLHSRTVERLYAPEFDYLRANTLLCQHISGSQRFVYHSAVCNDGNVPAFTKDSGAAAGVVPVIPFASARVTDGYRPRLAEHRPAEHRSEFGKTGRAENRHTRHRRQETHVESTVVRLSVSPYKARAVYSQNDMVSAYRHIVEKHVIGSLEK